MTSKPQQGPPKAAAQWLQTSLHHDPRQRCRGRSGSQKCGESVWVDWKLSIKTHKLWALKEKHSSLPILLISFDILFLDLYAPLPDRNQECRSEASTASELKKNVIYRREEARKKHLDTISSSAKERLKPAAKVLRSCAEHSSSR